MSAIGRGDTLECIDASPDRVTGVPCPLIAGLSYVVEWVFEVIDGRDGTLGFCVDLVGVPRMEGDIAYGLYRFKPVDSPTSDFLADIKAPAPKVLEPVSGRSNATSPQTSDDKPGMHQTSPTDQVKP